MCSFLSPLLPSSILESPSPSNLDGISAGAEFWQRAFCVTLICDYCVALRSAPTVRATASVLAHRFYHSKSVREFPPQDVAMGAVFLAGKAEEDARSMRSVVCVAYAAAARRRGVLTGAGPPLILGGLEYTNMKTALARCERFLLKSIGFQVHAGISTHHPQGFLLFFIRVLGGNADLAQAAWAALNDAQKRDLCVRHTPETIACGALYIAARLLNFPLPTQVPWTQVFGVTIEETYLVAAAILQVREMERNDKIGWIDLPDR